MKMNRSFLLVVVLCISCVNDVDHSLIDVRITDPDLSDKKELTFQQVFNLHNNPIGKDTIVTGYVVSSDDQGTFFKELYIQNTLDVDNISKDNPRMGIKIRVGLRAVSTKYVLGRKVAINLEGLKKTMSNNVLTIGTPSSFFIKDILEFDLDTHILKMDEVGIPIPKELFINELSAQDLNTLIKTKNIHFKENEVGIPFSGLSTDHFDGKRVLEFCDRSRRDTLILETSNFADFASKIIPNKQIDISGVYQINFDKEPVLVLNQFEDIVTIGAYSKCPEITTPDLMITEVADPKVGSGQVARYVEIYNPTEQDVSLEGWSLVRYNKTSKNENRHPIDLSGQIIKSKQLMIVANNDHEKEITWFETYFGFQPDIINTHLDGNGDDAYELIDPLDEVKDVYGIPNRDGTGLVWEYENGVALRKQDIIAPKKIFDVSEWIIKTEIAPLIIKTSNLDFTPRER